MSKKRNKKCCCQECCEPCCCNNATANNYGSCCGNVFGGLNNCVAPIIFLLIACGSGLNNNCSYLNLVLLIVVILWESIPRKQLLL